MKTKMTLEHFESKALPLLRIGCKTIEELQTKCAEYVKDIELTDGDEAVELKDIDLGEIETAEDETSEVVTKSEIQSIAKAAVAEAIKANTTARRVRPQTVDSETAQKSLKIEVKSHKFGRIKNFVDADGREDDEAAYRYGRFILATRGHQKSIQWCNDHELPLIKDGSGERITTKAQTEGTDTAGGVLVPPEFSGRMIELVLQYGVFRRNAYVEPMARETKTIMRRTGGFTAAFAAEAAAISESNLAWDTVNLSAKKAAFTNLVSNELNEDSVVNLGDKMAGEAALAFATLEDQCGFTGDGSATYGGIQGTNNRLITINGVDEGGGLILSPTNTKTDWVNLTLATFNRVVGALPDFPGLQPKWYCHKKFFHTVMARLQYASGGVTKIEVAEGVRELFLGFPVEFSNVFTSSVVTSGILCVFGDLAAAATMGDRRQTSIAFSDSATIGSVNAFERDMTAMRATERFDIVVHDVGTSSAAGPLVGLISDA